MTIKLRDSILDTNTFSKADSTTLEEAFPYSLTNNLSALKLPQLIPTLMQLLFKLTKDIKLLWESIFPLKRKKNLSTKPFEKTYINYLSYTIMPPYLLEVILMLLTRKNLNERKILSIKTTLIMVIP